MSRGFVKEGDQEEAPIVPPRAALPPQATNYVTPEGYQELLAERESLERAYNNRQGSDTEKRREAMLLDGKLNLLNQRIASARIIDPDEQPHEEVRFGATVELQNLNGPAKSKSMQLKIVGVDEADLKQGKIAFVAPLAKAAAGKKQGDEFKLVLGDEVRQYKVCAIKY